MPQDVLGVPWPAGPDQYDSIGDTFAATGYQVGVGMVHSAGTGHLCQTVADLPAGAPDGWMQWVENPGLLMKSNSGNWVKVAQSPQPWTAFTPTWTDSNDRLILIKSGTITGRYVIDSNKTMRLAISIVRGSDSQIGGVGVSGYKWVAPDGVLFKSAAMVGGTGTVRPSGGTGAALPCVIEALNSTVFSLNIATGAGRVSSDNPGSWQAGDKIFMSLTAEVQ